MALLAGPLKYGSAVSSGRRLLASSATAPACRLGRLCVCRFLSCGGRRQKRRDGLDLIGQYLRAPANHGVDRVLPLFLVLLLGLRHPQDSGVACSACLPHRLAAFCNLGLLVVCGARGGLGSKSSAEIRGRCAQNKTRDQPQKNFL